MSDRRKFPCQKCGRCCQSLAQNALFEELNRGDGICRHYDEQARDCRIYDTRDILCDVRRTFEQYFAHEFDWETFIDLNIAFCHSLNQNHKLKE